MTQRPTFVVCEDGQEYLDRFSRFFGTRFSFERAGDFAAAMKACRAGAAGLLLDLDFRRTPSQALVDDEGATAAIRTPDDRRRLTQMQGILILRALRAGGVKLPALLFADLDDAAQVAYITESLRPVTIVSSSTGLGDVANRLTEIAGSR